MPENNKIDQARSEFLNLEGLLAEKLFAAQWLESALGDYVADNLPSCYSDFTYDHYDYSIEIYNISEPLTQEELNKIWKMGFYACWTHSVSEHSECYVDGKPNPKNNERFYLKPSDWVPQID